MMCAFLSGAVSKITNLKFVKIYLSDFGVRHNVYLLRSLISGVLYSAFNMFAAILYSSRWFLSVSVYYILLVTTRYILYIASKKHAENGELSLSLYQSCRTVGVVMLFLNIAMATMIVYTTCTLRAQSHSVIVIYFLGIYSVSVFIFNVISILYNRKRRLPYSYIIARIISFCASFMSLFNFVNTLLYKLEISRHTAKLINGTVGAAVILSVLILCVSVICKCNRKILQSKAGGA